MLWCCLKYILISIAVNPFRVALPLRGQILGIRLRYVYIYSCIYSSAALKVFIVSRLHSQGGRGTTVTITPTLRFPCRSWLRLLLLLLSQTHSAGIGCRVYCCCSLRVRTAGRTQPKGASPKRAPTKMCTPLRLHEHNYYILLVQYEHNST